MRQGYPEPSHAKTRQTALWARKSLIPFYKDKKVS